MDCRSAAAQRTLSPELPATACSVLPRRRRNGPACHLDLAVCVDGSDRLGLDLNPIRGVVGVIAWLRQLSKEAAKIGIGEWDL